MNRWSVAHCSRNNLAVLLSKLLQKNVSLHVRCHQHQRGSISCDLRHHLLLPAALQQKAAICKSTSSLDRRVRIQMSEAPKSVTSAFNLPEFVSSAAAEGKHMLDEFAIKVWVHSYCLLLRKVSNDRFGTLHIIWIAILVYSRQHFKI